MGKGQLVDLKENETKMNVGHAGTMALQPGGAGSEDEARVATVTLQL